MKRIKRRVGDILEIRLDGGYLAFGQVLEEPLVAFFDVRSKKRLPVNEILNHPVAFSVWVMRYAITQGDFEVIGHAGVASDIDQHPPFFKVDNIAKKLFITYDGSEDIPATAADVQELERAAAWEPQHIVDRLNDHFAGRPNIWVERLRAPM